MRLLQSITVHEAYKVFSAANLLHRTTKIMPRLCIRPMHLAAAALRAAYPVNAFTRAFAHADTLTSQPPQTTTTQVIV